MAAEQLTAEQKKARQKEKQQERDRRRWAENKDREKERHRVWRLANLEVRLEREREKSRQWRIDRPEYWKARSAEYRKTNGPRLNEERRQDRLANLELYRERDRARRNPPIVRMSRLVITAGARAKRHGLEFDGLTHLIGTMPVECECCHTPLDYTRNGKCAGRPPKCGTYPSLDRKDNSRGYTKSNVGVVCLRCNMLKGDASLEELETIVAYMKRPKADS